MIPAVKSMQKPFFNYYWSSSHLHKPWWGAWLQVVSQMTATGFILKSSIRKTTSNLGNNMWGSWIFLIVVFLGFHWDSVHFIGTNIWLCGLNWQKNLSLCNEESQLFHDFVQYWSCTFILLLKLINTADAIVTQENEWWGLQLPHLNLSLYMLWGWLHWSPSQMCTGPTGLDVHIL